MKRLSLSGWKSALSRPRYVIWTGVGVLSIAGVLIVAVTATSSYWFCANVCHEIMDDAVYAYNHSPHANISCLACHTKLHADPVSFLLHKAEFGIDGGYKKLTKTFTLPPNAESAVALETPAEQCIQCHAGYKKISPSPGLKIDHDAHKDEGVACTVCHNRVAHQEKHTLLLAGNSKHADFMEMEGCFRCHTQEQKGDAPPGRCTACHTPGFDLTPESHSQPAFYTPFGDSRGHAELARDDAERILKAKSEQESLVAEEEPHDTESSHEELPPIDQVSYCGECHPTRFCDDCHGLEIPHPSGFKTDHSREARSNPASCGKCHASSKKQASSGDFCSDCHHAMGNESKPWFPQHPKYAKKDATVCVECHSTMYCETCHVSGKPKADH